MTKQTLSPAAGIFDSIRPAVIAYADHARKADRTGALLKDHADIGAVWDRIDYLTSVKAKAITLTVAREVLGYDKSVTLTRKDGKLASADAGRLEAVKIWIDRNRPKADDDAPKVRALTVSLSGEGGGSAKVAEDHPFYAALALMATGDADADTLVAMVMEAHAGTV